MQRPPCPPPRAPSDLRGWAHIQSPTPANTDRCTLSPPPSPLSHPALSVKETSIHTAPSVAGEFPPVPKSHLTPITVRTPTRKRTAVWKNACLKRRLAFRGEARAPRPARSVDSRVLSRPLVRLTGSLRAYRGVGDFTRVCSIPQRIPRPTAPASGPNDARGGRFLRVVSNAYRRRFRVVALTYVFGAAPRHTVDTTAPHHHYHHHHQQQLKPANQENHTAARSTNLERTLFFGA